MSPDRCLLMKGPGAAVVSMLLATGLALVAGACATDGQSAAPGSLSARASGTADAPGAADYVISRIEDLTVVDCLLPGRMRKMGQTLTWVDRPRPVKKTISDCEILGGQYVLFDRANFDTALAVWKVAADQGDPTAQTYVGEIYERGLGRTPDYALAAQWYRKAAAQGNARAQFRLGALHEKGLGVATDRLEALNWYRQAAGLPKDKVVYLSQVLAESRHRPVTPARGAGSRADKPPTAFQPAQAELQQIATASRTRHQELAQAETARDHAKDQIVMRSQESRLLDQAKPVIRADRRLIDQYVALTQEAETQRIAAESLERVLSVATPVIAQK